MSLREVISVRFIVAICLLVAATASLQGVIAWFKIILDKQEAPLRRPLELMPDRFGPYIVIDKQDRLPKEVEETLGTNQYISWVLKDTRLEPDELGSAVRLHVPFYTGMIDTVPHVPDRCFVGGSGAQVVRKDLIPVELNDPDNIFNVAGRITGMTMTGKNIKLPGRDLTLSIIQFNRAGAGPDQAYCVAYFFIANDKYVATPEGVRTQAFNPFDRHAYYAKIEVMPGKLVNINGEERFITGIGDPKKAATVVTDFLVYALPEVMYCLPDWEALNQEPEDAEPEQAGELTADTHG